MKYKRVVVIACMHCGHLVGLTPPQWWMSKARAHESNIPSHIPETQRRMWGAYKATLADLKPIHTLIVNGDCIEGKGGRSGATELLAADREEQASMAVQCIAQAEASNLVVIYGTAYHTGEDEDWENVVATRCAASGKFDECKIGSHEWVQVNGVIFDVKHHVGASSVPYGRYTAIARAKLWNMMWAERQEQPKAHFIIRSHVHYHVDCGERRKWRAMTTPALQAAGTKYGARRCEGTVDLGLVYVDCYEDGTWNWDVIRFAQAVRRASTLILE